MDIIKKAELNPKYFAEVKDLKCVCQPWQDFNRKDIFFHR